MDHAAEITRLQELIATLETEQNDLLSAAEDGVLNEDAQALYDDLDARISGAMNTIQRHQAALDRGAQLSRLQEPAGRRTTTSGSQDGGDGGQPRSASNGGTPGRRSVAIARPQEDMRGHHGFSGPRGFADFCMAVIGAKTKPSADERLFFNVAGHNESVGEEGGILVPPDFRDRIMRKILGEDSILSATDNIPTSSNTLSLPASETAPWDNTTGVQVYWVGEGRKITLSRERMEPVSLRLNKIAALSAITEELMEDAPAFEAYLNSRIPDKITDALNEAIIRGTGAGQPLGVLQSAHTVTVTPTASAATLLEHQDVNAMYYRVYGPWRANARWYIHPELEERLNLIAFKRDDATSPVPIYLPPGGLSASPYGTLMGRPVIPLQACSAPTEVGDIICMAPNQYLSSTKGGLRTDTSIHVYFDTDEMALRWILRVGGQPWWKEPISSKNGSYKQSSVTTLGVRT